jgi:hypothetical protein
MTFTEIGYTSIGGKETSRVHKAINRLAINNKTRNGKAKNSSTQ